MSDPIFFFVRRTARQVQMHVATGFTSDGKYTPMRSSHPDARTAQLVLGAFVRIAGKMDPARVDADKLLEAARGYLNSDTYERLRLIQATPRANLPARICLRAAS
jgi:hypothetical protein